MLTVAEAAERADVSESIVRSWVTAGLLPHFRLGAPGKRGKIAIAVEDLDALLASFKVVVMKPKPAPDPKPPETAFKHLKM